MLGEVVPNLKVFHPVLPGQPNSFRLGYPTLVVLEEIHFVPDEDLDGDLTLLILDDPCLDLLESLTLRDIKHVDCSCRPQAEPEERIRVPVLARDFPVCNFVECIIVHIPNSLY